MCNTARFLKLTPFKRASTLLTPQPSTSFGLTKMAPSTRVRRFGALLVAGFARVSSGSHDDDVGGCKATCYGASCDYWDGGSWGTCAHLESRWDCDCGGCVCDGCPQGSCDAPKFDPGVCTTAGDGTCDASGVLMNTRACAFDGGDCCPSTCRGVLCGSGGYDCRDPDVSAAERAAPATAPRNVRGDGGSGGRENLLCAMAVVALAVLATVPATFAALRCYRRRLAATGRARRIQEEMRQAKVSDEALATAAVLVAEVAVPLEKATAATFSDEPDCPICLGELGDEARALRCGHVFHAACLAPWFAGGIASNAALLCPLCKQDVKDVKAPDDVEAPKAAGDDDADGDAA